MMAILPHDMIQVDLPTFVDSKMATKPDLKVIVLILLK